MANFFGYRAVYADGHVEQEDGLILRYLNGEPNIKNQKKLDELYCKENYGEIIELHVYFES